ncbi:DUF6755 family protein [Catellatospora bangladeshensis]|uniref:DUF2530 domain-containing protein n=1 Tax=Catellatospora bangladeshensis TaxID=310355 RepID=A0A8J3JK98_9ACTN|nr:DUF6755 family protein [Catellatospora bangladeshensis]GIF80163.1 hypothetical protein Cba03nite_15120 [Catellatospora bangladeshensis]
MTHDRYPRIRPTSGYADPRIRSTGPGPGAGVETDPERSSMLSGRLALVLSIVVGQLWAITIGLNAWMMGQTRTAWWAAAFSVASFLVALWAWRLGERRDR